jgi:hypothetical protein
VLVYSSIHQEIGRSFGDCCSNPQSSTVPLSVIDQPVTLAGEIAIQCMQRGPQLSGRCNGPSLTLTDALDADLRIL